jgi:hypothetical protein
MVLFYPLLCPIAANVPILDRDGKDMTEGGLESKCSDNIKSSDELAEKSSGSLGLSGAGKYNPADTETCLETWKQFSIHSRTTVAKIRVKSNRY